MTTKIKGITADSREVKPGYTFVAVKGLTYDGHDFVDQAIQKGASLIYGEKNLKFANYFKVDDARKKLGELAAEFYGNPSKKLKVIGVTGTKGKTTTCHLIHHILVGLGHKTGLISSISVPGLHVTNPDVITLNKMLKGFVDDGCEYAVVEVSSHGIHQGRVMGVDFEVGVLTHIAPEHLDYHKTFKEYKKVKMSFINSAKHKVIAPKETKLNLLTGDFNNIDLEAALEAVSKLGFDKNKALATVKNFTLPEGRMDEIKNGLGVKIYVDFAHTPDSLEAALKYLKKITQGKLISVFGCAGLRDHKKRSKMGQISFNYADLSIFTAEDPRTENIFEILKSMHKKLPKDKYGKKYIAIPERSEAIYYALKHAEKGDVIGFFGKGHEASMCYLTHEHPWSEKEMINSQLAPLKDLSVVVLAAGKGTRMKSQKPKVIHEICGRPMLSYTLENLRKTGAQNVVLVLSFRKNMIKRKYPHSVSYAYQKNPKGGTADAVKSGLSQVSKNSKLVLVLHGDDSAFYTSKTINDVINTHKKSKAVVTFVSLVKNDPTGLGRVIRDKAGRLHAIVEEKDATDEQRKIKEINDGLYVFNKDWIEKTIKEVKKGPQGEFYLVDIVHLAVAKGEKIEVYKLPNDNEWHGINTPQQLQEAEDKMKERLLG